MDYGFTCLSGEELSVREHIPEKEFPLLLGCDWPVGIFGEAHIQAIGINNYIPQIPFGIHCPLWPSAQKAIEQIHEENGVAVIAHPYSKVVDFDFLDFKSVDRVRDKEDGIEIWNGAVDDKYNKKELI